MLRQHLMNGISVGRCPYMSSCTIPNAILAPVCQELHIKYPSNGGILKIIINFVQSYAQRGTLHAKNLAVITGINGMPSA